MEKNEEIDISDLWQIKAKDFPRAHYENKGESKAFTVREARKSIVANRIEGSIVQTCPKLRSVSEIHLCTRMVFPHRKTDVTDACS